MTKYDFDKVINRKNTGSVKHDFMKENNRPEDTLPLWVADMDFQAPEPVIKALRDACDHGIFGYTNLTDEYFDAAQNWFSTRFNWRPEKDWLITTPGVVFAFNIAVQALTSPGDAVLIQPPVYYPFFAAIENNNRVKVENPLILEGEEYKIDFDDFEKKIVENNVKLFILCSPHNPIGRVWTREELSRVGSICKKHNVFIVADEIHCDFTWNDHTHTMFLDACPDCHQLAISCTAPSKTFNLAGLQTSNIWIPNEEIRKSFYKVLDSTGFFTLNMMGILACKTAYAEGAEWFSQCKEYIYDNYLFLKDFIKTRLPMLKVMDLQGTYLAWVDFSSLGKTPDEINDLISNKAKVWLDEGQIFGKGGENYQRFVLACPRKTLEEALTRIESAIKEL